MSEGRIWPLVFSFSWPALVSMTLNALYSVVDRVYIGQGCGGEAIAGLALTFPLLMFYAAFAILVGVGCSTLLSIRLGEGDRESAERLLGQCVLLKVVLGLTLPTAMWIFLDPLLRVTGGSQMTPAALAAAKEYLNIVLFAQLFAHLAFGFAASIRAEGAPKQSMHCMVAGFGLNFLLDPILIFDRIPLGFGWSIPGLGWKIAGAAWATNIAMLFSCLWALRFYWSGQSAVGLRLRHCLHFYPRLALRGLAVGTAPFLQHLASTAIVFVLNLQFAKWALTPENRTICIASFGIVQTVMLIAFMPILGLQQGLGPMLGFNWGARNFGRVREILWVGIKVTMLASVAAWALQVFGNHWLARCFVGASEERLLSTVTHDIRFANCMVWLIGLNILCTTFYQSIGRPKIAIFLSLLRQVVCLIPCAIVLPHFLENHLMGVWASLPVSDTLCCLASIPPALIIWKKLRLVSAR